MATGLEGQGNPGAGGQPSIAAQKYGSNGTINVDELMRGYDNQYAETQRIVAAQRNQETQLQQLQKQNEILMGLVEQPGRMNPAAQSAARASKLDPLAEKLELPREQLVEALVEALSPILDQRAGAAVDQRVGPLLRGTAARQIVSSTNPNYAAQEPAVAQFLNENPDVNTRFQKALENPDPQFAAQVLENAFLRTQLAAGARGAGSSATPPPSGAETSAEQELQNRLDARITGGAPSRAIVGVEPNRAAQLSGLLDQAEQSGNYSQFLDVFLGNKVPAEHTR